MAYSRKFKHRTANDPYDELQHCPPTGNEICKTSFREHQVRSFLTLNDSADEIKVIEVQVSGKKYFALQAREDGNDLNNPLIGDLPCPEDCIPPGLEENTSFDKADVLKVINTTHCLWLQVHRSRMSDVISYLDFSIYALTDDGNGGLINQWNNGDIMYTTI